MRGGSDAPQQADKRRSFLPLSGAWAYCAAFQDDVGRKSIATIHPQKKMSRK